MAVDTRMASELGFLGLNVYDEVSTDWCYTELVRRAEEGDKTALFNMYQLARHYEGTNAEEIKNYLYAAIDRIDGPAKPSEAAQDTHTVDGN